MFENLRHARTYTSMNQWCINSVSFKLLEDAQKLCVSQTRDVVGRLAQAEISPFWGWGVGGASMSRWVKQVCWLPAL